MMFCYRRAQRAAMVLAVVIPMAGCGSNGPMESGGKQEKAYFAVSAVEREAERITLLDPIGLHHFVAYENFRALTEQSFRQVDMDGQIVNGISGYLGGSQD